jgi:Tfp pilus assembly PilM family ATPase
MSIFRSFPPDIAVLDLESILHVRMQKGSKGPKIVAAKSYPLPENTFTRGVITPLAGNDGALSAVVRRMKMESGRMDRVSLLLPDSWFRMNILDLPSLPDKANEAAEMVGWTLKRTLPMKPEEVRVAWRPVSQNGSTRVLVFAAHAASLSALESAFAAAGVDVVLIEPAGINIWNSIVARETIEAAEPRVFLYVRRQDFTTALFRGTTPLFLRSRLLGGERSLIQEIRLSSSFLRSNYELENIHACYVAGNGVDSTLAEEIASEFGAPARRITLRDFADYEAGGDPRGMEAELTACTGVFTD